MSLDTKSKYRSYRERFYALMAHYQALGYPDPTRAALVIFRHNGRASQTFRRGRSVKIAIPREVSP